jgi:hypothetical protein
MGARRDDITGSERAQIAQEMLPSYRPDGKVSQLAEQYSVSRQTIYAIAASGKALLEQQMAPGPHGARVGGNMVRVDRERVERSTVILTRFGVSQRDIPLCLAEVLDTQLSAGWVNGQLAQREALASAVNQQWQPSVAETLSGDEIYSNGSPNLLVVGNESLYIYALTRQPSCDGDTWGCVLLDSPHPAQFASDGWLGLAAGAQAAGVTVHQLDWDHLLRPLWGHAARLERQAYAALEALEARANQFHQARTARRLAHHLAIWEHLHAEAEAKLAQCESDNPLEISFPNGAHYRGPFNYEAFRLEAERYYRENVGAHGHSFHIEPGVMNARFGNNTFIEEKVVEFESSGPDAAW